MRLPGSLAAKGVTRIDRYVIRQLFIALIAVTGGLVALIWLTQSLRFVELVVNRGLSFKVFFQLTGLLIPYFVGVILPITTFCVVQFVYQRLAGDRELTVMRGSGLSPLALARPALALAGMTMALMYVLNVWVVPRTSAAFREFQFEIRNRVAAFLLQDGVFTSVSDDLTVYVRARDANGTLHGVLVDDARQKNSRATILAEQGRLEVRSGVPRVLLINGSRQEIDKQTGRLNVLTFQENVLDLTDSSKNDETRYRDASEMSLTELLHPEGLVQPRDYLKLRAEAHRRLAQPLNTLSFSMVALVASLMGGFRRHGNILRPLVSVLTVVGLLALGLAIGNLAVRSETMIPMIWVVAIMPTLVCWWLLIGPEMGVMPARWQVRFGAA